MAKVKRKARGNVDTLDFSGVKAGGATIPDGRYKAKIISAELKEGKESGEPYRDVTWEITSDKCNGREVKFDRFSLQPQALWKIKGMLEAMEVEVPDGEHDVDWDELISDETECIVEFVGKPSNNDADVKYARAVGYAPLSDGGTVDDDEEEDGPKPKKKPAKDTDEDDTPPRRAGKKPAKDEEEEEEEEEDEPKPSGKKLKKGAKVKFKDEKNKLTKGTLESVDGDTATVVTDDKDTYEISVEELTVIG